MLVPRSKQETLPKIIYFYPEDFLACMLPVHDTPDIVQTQFSIQICLSVNDKWLENSQEPKPRIFLCSRHKTSCSQISFQKDSGLLGKQCWWKLAHINLRQDTVEHCVWTPRLISTYSLTMNKPAALRRMTMSRADGKTAIWAISLLSMHCFLNICLQACI